MCNGAVHVIASLPESGAVGQAGGPGSVGATLPPRRQQMEELVCRLMPVMQDVMYPSQTACGGDGVDLRETVPDDAACCFHKPLESLSAAGKAHQESVG